MVAALIVFPFCSEDGSIVGFIIGIVMSVFIVVVVVVVVAHPRPSPPLSSPPLRHVTLGDGACKRAHNHNRIGQGGGSKSSGDGKKVKNHGIVHRVTHDFYVKINPRQKLDNAVACTSVAPMRLHHQFATQE
jgi:hypothetical protein